jgi:hypothetical protein
MNLGYIGKNPLQQARTYECLPTLGQVRRSTMAADVAGKWRTISMRVLRAAICLIFLGVGTVKLTGTGNTVEYGVSGSAI